MARIVVGLDSSSSGGKGLEFIGVVAGSEGMLKAFLRRLMKECEVSGEVIHMRDLPRGKRSRVANYFLKNVSFKSVCFKVDFQSTINELKRLRGGW